MASNDDPFSVGGVTRTSGAPAPTGTQAVDGAESASAAAGVEAVAATRLEGVDAVAEAVATGAMDVEAATRELVAQSVARMLGPGADPAVVEEIRAEVEAMLVGDPTLAVLLRGA